MFTIAFIVYLVITASEFQDYVWGRCVCAAIVTFIPTFAFYYVIGLPAYKW